MVAIPLALRQELVAYFEAMKERMRKLRNSDRGKPLPGGAPLWNGVPEIDSKAVAETSPIWEKHLGIPLDTRLIRPGGYASFDEFLSELGPRMLRKATLRRGGS